MIWLILVLGVIAAAPFVREALRSKMGPGVRARAPGRFAELPSGLTHYDWIGPSRGPVAVCVHGLTTPSFVWRALGPMLATLGFRVLIYDLYGRGFSDRVRGRQDAAFFLRQLEELLDDQAIREPATFVGYSMGGAIVTAFAAAHPGRVQRLVLLAPAGMELKMDAMALMVRDVPLVGDWLFHAFWPSRFRDGVLSDPRPSAVDNIAARQLEELDVQGFVPAVLSSTRGLLARSLAEEHRAVAADAIPVLAIWGRDDDVIPLRAVGRLTEWNRDCRQEVIDGAGHGLPYTHPAEVTEAIRRAMLDGF
ncbi:alpha/beta fold hydrolase [Pseudaestuariivita atlantica]|uniref:Alpha/beta hydrolase n=1 Tax=Pseudaestuariivita atlantica TaxID=1317121 RepID=A0A0L1JNV2_9RHOB|nr:alpha/beta hydrolase [Pseudaestuariivita atlantica]KNG93424.1 alpha/beta hydrolase [Pseudaestuariivita atlantica]